MPVHPADCTSPKVHAGYWQPSGTPNHGLKTLFRVNELEYIYSIDCGNFGADGSHCFIFRK